MAHGERRASLKAHLALEWHTLIKLPESMRASKPTHRRESITPARSFWPTHLRCTCGEVFWPIRTKVR